MYTIIQRKNYYKGGDRKWLMEKYFTDRPVSLNTKNNLLEIEEHMYILDDVEKPNVFRNMFPYSEVPKIPF